MNMSQEVVPKKIYRHVLKALQFFHTVDGSGTTLNEVISYVFLKNQRIYKPALIQKWVTNVLGTFQASGMLQDDPWGRFQLHDVLQGGPPDSDENYVLNPEHARQHADNSSQETLSGTPHYQRVLRRKGTANTLPKHRTHAASHVVPQHETSNLNTEIPTEEEPQCSELISGAKLDMILDPGFGRNSDLLDDFDLDSPEEDNLL